VALGREGYGSLRVDDIAAEAGVAKTTLYRRWQSKDQLVADAVRSLFLEHIPRVDTGELRGDLLALVQETHNLLFEGPGRIIEDLVRESGTSRDLAGVVRATNDARRRVFHEALNRAVARGEVAPALQHELVIDILVGPLWTRRLVTGAPVTAEDIEAVVEVVLDGIRPAQPRDGTMRP
jgi:AcrR family transcriptional regulator